MTDHAPYLERLLFLEPCEQAYAIDAIEGEIPDFIRGIYYLNGPGLLKRDEHPYRHWLDGDGMVCALRFEPGHIYFTNRFVRNTKFIAETEAGHPIFRTFGTAFAGDQMKRGISLESPVNVSVYPFGESLLAFGEQGLPWELDPVTLETRGLYTFGGRLNDISPFSAHPKFDPVTGEMFNFGMAFSANQPCVHIYRFSADGQLTYRKRLSLPYPCSVHDFGLSPHYMVLYLNPYILNVAAMVQEGKTLLEALQWQPELGSTLLLISRETGDIAASVSIGKRYCLHLINCFETGQYLTVDVVEYDRPIYDQYQVLPELFTDVCEARPVRFILDSHVPTRFERYELATHLAPDFPALDPRQGSQPYDHFWMLGMGAPKTPGRKFFNQLIHSQWTTPQVDDIYQAPASCYLGGEPLFIGDPNHPSAGVVLCQTFDAMRAHSGFAIFNAHCIARGPIGYLHLRHPIPPLFHASFQQYHSDLGY